MLLLILLVMGAKYTRDGFLDGDRAQETGQLVGGMQKIRERALHLAHAEVFKGDLLITEAMTRSGLLHQRLKTALEIETANEHGIYKVFVGASPE
jgi:hypothetical protein